MKELAMHTAISGNAMEQVSGYGEGLGSRFQKRRKKKESVRESEERFRTMADTALIWTTDADKLCTYVSQTWLDLTGKIFEELGKGWADDIHPSDRDARLEAYAHCFDQRSPFTLEYRVRRHDGEYRWLLDKGTPRFASDGTFLGYIGSATDITERKCLEERLRVQHTVAQILAEAATIEEATPRILLAMGDCLGWDVGVLWRVDREAEALRCVELWHKASIAVPEFERVSREFTFGPGFGLPGRVWSSLEPEYIPDVAPDENFPRAPIAEQEGLRAAFAFPILLGREVLGVIEFFSREIRQPDQELLNVLATIGSQIGQFIERKRAEEALRRSEAYLAEAQRLSHCGVTAYKGSTVFYGSEEIYRIWGFDPAQGVPSRKAVLQRIHPDDRDRLNAEVERALGEKRRYSAAYRIVLPDGTVKHLESIGQPVFSTNGELVEVVATQIDVTERKRAEEGLRESEAKLRDYAETASDWFWEIDPDYKFTLLTENAFGSNPADRIGTACWDHALDLETEPEKWRLIQATLDSRKPFRDFVYCSARGDGSPMYVKASGKPVFDAEGEFRGYRGTGTDVTALRTAEAEARENEQRYRKAELELAYANRVAAMGQLTASITHEVNQPITAAVTNAQAALRW